MKQIIIGLLICMFSLSNAVAQYQSDNTDELEKQIEAGLDVNTRDENGDTLFYWFLVNGDSLKPLQVLVDAGANINAPSASDGMTPLVYATTMAARSRAEAQNRMRGMQTANERQIAEANMRKEIKDKLMYALEVVRFLIESGAEINQETPYGTPLMSAATSDWNSEIIDYLIQSGANVNQQDRNGRTALFYASAYDSKQVTIQLISAGADINIQDNDGRTYMEVPLEELQKK